MSRLRSVLETGGFAVTGEVGPPKGVNTDGIAEAVEILGGRVVALNVTDLQSAVMRVGSLATCRLLLDRGVEPVLQLTCRDRNRLALQSELLSAWVLGIENVLCLTGDHIVLGDHREAKPVFDLDSVQLLKAASMLNAGRDMAGHALDGKPDLFAGAVVTPNFEPLELQLTKMRKKMDAGAKFFQTQAVFEPEKFARFAEQAAEMEVPVLAGIVVLKSAAMARFMNKNVAGVFVPDALIEEMDKTAKGDRKKKAAEIGARIIEGVRGHCQGVHLMPLGWDDVAVEMLDMAGL